MLLLFTITANTILDPFQNSDSEMLVPEFLTNKTNQAGQTFPVLPPVALFHLTEPQPTKKHIMINTAKKKT